jgi:hypothetical protein
VPKPKVRDLGMTLISVVETDPDQPRLKPMKDTMMSITIPWRHALWAAPLTVALLAGWFFAATMMQPPADDLDLTLSKSTEAGLYLSTIAPAIGPASVGPMHAWTVTVTTPDGAPVEGAQIGWDGGMPQHGHGLPTSPQMTEALGEGGYLIEGMRFNMPGWWTLTVTIDGNVGTDQVTYNVVL